MQKITKYGTIGITSLCFMLGLTAMMSNKDIAIAENTTETITEIIATTSDSEEISADLVSAFNDTTETETTETNELSMWDKKRMADYYRNMYGPKEKKTVTVNGYEIDYIAGAPSSVYDSIAYTMEKEEEANNYVETNYTYEAEADYVPDEQPVSNDVSGEAAPSMEGMTFYTTATLTAYCWTGNPCADGVYPSVGYTVACNDPNLWHRWIYIEGLGTYFVHDTGGMPSYNIIDVYMGNYDSCINFGCQSANVYVLN